MYLFTCRRGLRMAIFRHEGCSGPCGPPRQCQVVDGRAGVIGGRGADIGLVAGQGMAIKQHGPGTDQHQGQGKRAGPGPGPRAGTAEGCDPSGDDADDHRHRCQADGNQGHIGTIQLAKILQRLPCRQGTEVVGRSQRENQVNDEDRRQCHGQDHGPAQDQGQQANRCIIDVDQRARQKNLLSGRDERQVAGQGEGQCRHHAGAQLTCSWMLHRSAAACCGGRPASTGGGVGSIQVTPSTFDPARAGADDWMPVASG